MIVEPISPMIDPTNPTPVLFRLIFNQRFRDQYFEAAAKGGQATLPSGERAGFEAFAQDVRLSALAKSVVCPVSAMLVVRKAGSLSPLFEFMATPEFEESYLTSHEPRPQMMFEYLQSLSTIAGDPVLREILRYEECLWKVKQMDPRPGEREYHADRQVRLSANVLRVRFPYDILEVMDKIEKKLESVPFDRIAPLLMLAKCPIQPFELDEVTEYHETHVVFIPLKKGTQRGMVDIIRITPDYAIVLDACCSQMRAKELVDETASMIGEAVSARVVRTLLSLGVLEYAQEG